MQIAILLSTYNGENYLEKQLDSIISQTFQNWILYIRDDGSKDNTLEIVNTYVKKYPLKIKLIADDLGNLKSSASFMQLLNTIDSFYYMFCDQDDIWLSDKIEKTYNKLTNLERTFPEKPALVFSNLLVVDANLEIINHSMWEYSGIDPNNALDFYKTTCLSTVTGCTVMINNLLKRKVLPYPKTGIMHDWWICLIALHFGVVDYLNETTVLYRQHEKNVLGAEAVSTNYYLKKISSLKTTISNNIKVYRMLKSLPFEVDFYKIVKMKIKIVLTKC